VARSGRPPDLLWPAPGAYARARAKRRGRARPSHRVCSPRARGLSAGVGGHVSACPVRAVHMVAGAAPLLRRARRAAVRDGHSRRARSSQTRCGPRRAGAPGAGRGVRKCFTGLGWVLDTTVLLSARRGAPAARARLDPRCQAGACRALAWARAGRSRTGRCPSACTASMPSNEWLAAREGAT